jgi:phosphoesterase RecJ-like protein
MVDPLEYHNVGAWLQHCQRPLLITHRRPDGDALGALVAAALALRTRGLDPRPTLFEAFPPRYALLRDLVPWHRWPEERAALEADSDALVIVDTCASTQLGPIAAYLPRAPRTLVIDHHPTPDPLATRPGDLRLLDETAGAVCLILTELVRALDVPLSPPLATALFVGLATDCGWFRYSNTDARVLRAATELAGAGAVPNVIYRAIYEQDSPARLRLTARVLQSLRLLADDRLAVLTLRQADFAAAGADSTMTEDLVNEASRLGCVEATILFTEEPDGHVRANFRSKSTLDVSALARSFGGGGHVRAAGARPPGSWDDVIARVTAAAVAALAQP